MKGLRKHLIGVLVAALLVSAVPASSYATQTTQPTGKQFFTIKGTRYSIEKSQGMVRVEELKKGKAVSSCTAYVDDGYMLSEVKNNSGDGKAVTDVIWLDSIIKEVRPTSGTIRKSLIIKPWTLDGKYTYKPVQVSLNPTKYKQHTAYYMYQPITTKFVTRQINFAKGTSIPAIVVVIEVLIGLVCNIFAPPIGVAITIDLVSAIGLGVSGYCITQAYSPTLRVDATTYKAKFVDALGNSNGQTFSGERLTVTDQEDKRFNKSYYEGYAPQISQKFAYTAFLNTFKGGFIKYPGLKLYTEY